MVDELKITLAKMTMFDALRLPDHIDLLEEALKFNNGRKITNEDNVIISIFDDVPRALIGIRRPPPFYISLRLEGWVVNNCMIDTRATIIVMPRAVAEAMKFYIT